MTSAADSGIQGVANLQAFIAAGGLFITVADNASLAIDFGITSGCNDPGSSSVPGTRLGTQHGLCRSQESDLVRIR
jgi:hypothetical protein